jgi:hypothetical protein
LLAGRRQHYLPSVPYADSAREAGIAPSAFEQALAELRARDPAAAAAVVPSWLPRLARFWPAALILAAVMSIFLVRLLFPAL